MKNRSSPVTLKLPFLVALFDSEGAFCGTYESYEEAKGDAWGPRFRPHYFLCEMQQQRGRRRKVMAK